MDMSNFYFPVKLKLFLLLTLISLETSLSFRDRTTGRPGKGNIENDCIMKKSVSAENPKWDFLFLKFFDVASELKIDVEVHHSQSQMSKICFPTYTDVGDNVDDHCWTFARWGSNACTTCQELAATCRTTSRCKNWDENQYDSVFGDILGHNFGNWISIVFLKPSKCKTIELLARYVAQQCSQPVSLLGDQKGLRMIKVTYFLGIFKRKVVKQLLIKS